MAKETGDKPNKDSSRQPRERQSETGVKQDSRGRDNQGRGPLVDNKDAGRKDDNRREQEKRGS